jgi:replicative DNA helicase
LQRGDLSLLGGRPSTGKTTAALQIVNQAIISGVGTMLFSLETPAKTLLRRLACMSMSIDYQKWRSGALGATEQEDLFQETERLRTDRHLRINERALATVPSIHADLRRTKGEQEIGLVVIDYLQLMHSAGKHQNRVSEVSEISRDLKLAAVEFQLPFLVLSQLNRTPETENRAPQLSDLRESGSLEQDADLVIFLWCPKSEMVDDYHATATEMIVAKQRNGPIGAFDTLFVKRLARLEEAAAESPAFVGR